MTAVSSSSSLSQQQYVLDLQKDGKHKYGQVGDADGDGKPDGDSLAGDENGAKGGSSKGAIASMAIASSALKADTTNSLSSIGSAASGTSDALSARGISVGAKGLSSVDGFTADSPNAKAALDFSGPPTLPEVSATSSASTASTRSISTLGAQTRTATTSSTDNATSSALSYYMGRTGGEDAALMWEALSEMAKTSRHDIQDAAELKNALQAGKVDAKKAEIKSTENQFDAEKRAAGMNLAFSVAAAGVQIVGSVGMGGVGGGAVGDAVGRALSPVITSLGQYINKTVGPQAEADKEKIRAMNAQMTQEVMEQGVENAKSNYDDAKESFKLALKIMTEHSERQTQISSTITRT